MVYSGTKITPLCFSCGAESKVHSWTFQLAPVSVPLLGADFLKYFYLLVDINEPKVVSADDPESVILSFSSSSLTSSLVMGSLLPNLVTIYVIISSLLQDLQFLTNLENWIQKS